MALPEPAIEQLLPVWAANRYRPQRGDDDELPAALGLPSPVYRVPGYHVPKRRLVHALADGLQDRMVNGALARTADGYQVRRQGQPEGLDVEAGAVMAAGGYDTVPFLREELGVHSDALDRPVALVGRDELVPWSP